MSELLSARAEQRDFRRQLMTTSSVLVLLGAVFGPGPSKASDEVGDRPTIWIELGGQLDHITGQGDPFVPGFLAANPNSVVLRPTTPLQAQRPVPFSFAEDGKITLQPTGSDWTFAVSVRYGRSSSFKHVDHQTNRVSSVPFKYGSGVSVTAVEKFANTKEKRQQSYAVLDFSAGKDVGLGLFGTNGSSVLSLGIRFAQFSSTATFDVRARPDLRVMPKYYGTYKLPLPPHVYFHTYHASGSTSRNFRGVGPSISWSGSAAVVGQPESGELALAWGGNASLLFGRQKAVVQHHESGHYKNQPPNNAPYESLYHRSGGHDTNRSVLVPNVGGFAGASYRIENFKLSAGYRADFFFGAIDGGIDARKSETLGVYGPFATISVGLP